jgi:catechol 2,3-dioxygenase-like lactoylglutathione lyase family enzyme
MLLLFNPLGSRDSSDEIPPHGSFGPGHVAFGVREAELPGWADWLGQKGIPVERTIDWPGGGRSLYFRDPAGNSLELATPRIWGLDERTLG